MSQDLLVWLCNFTVEALLMFYCGARLLGLRTSSTRFFTSGLFFSVLIPLARRLPLPFGWHTIVLFVAFIVVFGLTYRTSVGTATLSSILAFFLLSTGDMLVLGPALSLLKWKLDVVLASPGLHILAGYMADSLLILTAACATVFRFRLTTAPEAAERGRAGR